MLIFSYCCCFTFSVNWKFHLAASEPNGPKLFNLHKTYSSWWRGSYLFLKMICFWFVFQACRSHEENNRDCCRRWGRTWSSHVSFFIIAQILGPFLQCKVCYLKGCKLKHNYVWKQWIAAWGSTCWSSSISSFVQTDSIKFLGKHEVVYGRSNEEGR